MLTTCRWTLTAGDLGEALESARDVTQEFLLSSLSLLRRGKFAAGCF